MSPRKKKGKGKKNDTNKNSPQVKDVPVGTSSSVGQKADDPRGSLSSSQFQDSEPAMSYAPRNGNCEDGKPENGMRVIDPTGAVSSVGASSEEILHCTPDDSMGSEGNAWKRAGKKSKVKSPKVILSVGSPALGTGAEGYQEDFPSLTSQLELTKNKQTAGKQKTQFEDDFPALSPSKSCAKGNSSTNPSTLSEVKAKSSSVEMIAGNSVKRETRSNVDYPELATSKSCAKQSYTTAPSSPPSEAACPSLDRHPKNLPKITSPSSAPLKLKLPSSKHGSIGRPISLITNYYDLKSRLRYVYHYDVAISEVKMDKSKTNPVMSPSKASSDNCSRLEKQQQANVSKRLCQEVFAKFINIFKASKKMERFQPIYDGVKNLFTAQKLPIQDTFNCRVPMEVDGKKKLYMISLKPVKKLDGSNVINMHSLENSKSYNLETMNEVLLVLNAIMNHRGANSSEIRVGRSFFSLTGGDRINVGEGLEIWRGYSQSVHLTEKGPAIVLNLSARVFHKAGEAINYIAELLDRDITNRNRLLTFFELKKIEKALVNVRVKVTHLRYPRQYRINAVTDRSAEDLKITIDGKEKSIAQYFREKYGGLKFPHLHCFQMNAKNNKTFVPFEKCVILPDQPKAGSCDDLSRNVTNRMISETAVTPAKRFSDIDKYAKGVNKISSPQMNEFQLFMDLSPKKVKGRVLDAPALRYFSGQLSSPKNGTWNLTAGQRFFKAQRFESWILLSFIESQEKLCKFTSELGNKFHELGLFFKSFKGIRTFRENVSTETILNDSDVKSASLVVIVLSKKNTSSNYDEIKFIADYRIGLVTQCVLDNVLFKMDPRILTNICLKINTKLGGVNHELANPSRFLKEPVIILGADVVHSTMCPSIAAVVGSMDAYVSTYKVCCRIQENEKRGKKSQELILELESMVEILLKSFLNYTKGVCPTRIICYRDGVSEGQFVAVRDHEVVSIRNASKTVFNKLIPITFMIVQKRHQTRLRPENPKDGIGRGLNIPPGTTVDTDITYPNTFDFFLCSHEGIRGTSKPSRYTILYDENDFGADELEKFTYDLCHLYGRCTKSVSIPAPVKYADLAAYRAKKYADFHIRKMRKNKSSPVHYSGKSSDLPKFARDAINNMEMSKNHMFFI